LKFQIDNAKKRTTNNSGQTLTGKILLESYNTGDLDEIVDILEIYHVKDRTLEGVQETLDELAYSASVLSRESLQFGFNEEGHFALFLSLNPTAANS
jgi:hypothetical protein